MPKASNNQKGQALLIIVLVMVVALTVGLSVVARTITNLKTTTDQANSQKSLSAAEAGVERAIQNIKAKNNASISDSFDNNSSFQTTLTPVTAVANQKIWLNGGNLLKNYEGSYVWITPYDVSNFNNLFTSTWPGSQLTIYWGNSGEVCNTDPSLNTMAALEVVVVTGTKANPSVKTYAFDPCADRAASNHFTVPTAAGTTLDGRSLPHSTGVISISQGLLVKVIPMYADTYVSVMGDQQLPQQGTIIQSTGTSNGTQRSVTVFEGYPELPSELFPLNLLTL